MRRPYAIVSVVLVSLVAITFFLLRTDVPLESDGTGSRDLHGSRTATRDGEDAALEAPDVDALPPERAEFAPTLLLPPLTSDVPTARLVGEVEHAETRLPIGDVEVELIVEVPSHDPTSDAPRERRSTRIVTNDRGRFDVTLPVPSTLLSGRPVDRDFLVGEERSLRLDLLPDQVATLALRMRDGRRIVGRVVDRDGRAMAGATVMGWRHTMNRLYPGERPPPDQRVSSRSDGSFDIGPWGEGVTLEAAAERWVAYSRLAGQVAGSDEFSTPSPDRSIDVNSVAGDDILLVVARPRVVAGRVIGPHGAPIENCRVTFVPDRDWHSVSLAGFDLYREAAGESVTLTDRRGDFSFPSATPQAGTVRAEHPRYPVGAGVAVSADEDRRDIEIVLKEGAELHGVVSGPEGPIHLATVRLDAGEYGATHQQTVKSDARGEFSFYGLDPSERAILYVRALGHAILVLQPVALRPREPTRLRLSLLPEATLRGEVIDGDGNPVPYAQLTIEGERLVSFGPLEISPPPTWERRLGIARTSSDEKGAFEFRELNRGSYRLHAVGPPPDQHRASLTVDAGTIDLQVRLGPSRETVTLTGRVRDAMTGRAIDHFSVTPLVPMSSGGSSGNRVEFRSETGEFRITGLTAGSVRVQVEAEGFVTSLSDATELRPGTHRIDVDLSPARSISVRVTDDSGKGIESRLRFADGDNRPVTAAIDSRSRRSSVTTDADGKVLLRGLPAGRLFVTVEAEGMRGARVEFDLTQPPTIEQRIVLQAAKNPPP